MECWKKFIKGSWKIEFKASSLYISQNAPQRSLTMRSPMTNSTAYVLLHALQCKSLIQVKCKGTIACTSSPTCQSTCGCHTNPRHSRIGFYHPCIYLRSVAPSPVLELIRCETYIPPYYVRDGHLLSHDWIQMDWGQYCGLY